MMFLRIPANLANWPTPARLAAAHRIPTDFGLGNTATRLKNVVELARELGGMAPESLWLNYRFPYTTPKTITITLSANGIGDAVCALYAAAGLARVTDRPIELVTRHRAWLEGFHVPGVEIVAQSDGQHINANWDYDRQVKSATSRKQDYCNALADALFLPPFPPQKPTRRTSVTPRARRIILAPFSEGPDRIWPYWKELARVLIDAGEEVVGVGAAKDAWAMAGICSGVAVIATGASGCGAASVTSWPRSSWVLRSHALGPLPSRSRCAPAWSRLPSFAAGCPRGAP